MTARETLRSLAPVIGDKRVKHLWHVYLASDTVDRRELECALEAYAARILKDSPAINAPGLFPPPPAAKCAGEITLGNVKYAEQQLHPFGLRKQEMLRHVGIYGSSGCGKSNGIALIIDGLTKLGTPFLLCDFKRTFRSLVRDYPKLLVFTAGDSKTSPFRFNPLIPPPGTSVEVWGKKVIGALSHAFCQGAGSESLLVSAMNATFKEVTAQGRWPTFRDVTKTLENQPAKGRKGMWMDSARRAAASLSTGGAADVFCPDISLDIGQLLRQSVILELDLLNQAEQTFLSEVLLLWIIQFRMHNNMARESLQHTLIIEEAHHLLRSPPGMGDGSEPVIHIALREVRELGESIILATQNSSVVPVAVFGNQATTLAFHTKHASDVRATAQAMLLRDEAKDELGRLPVGEAIVRVARWADPIHIALEYRPIAKGKVSDSDIRRHMESQAYSTDTAPYHAPLPQKPANSPIPLTDEKKVKQPEYPSTQATSNQTDVTTPTTTPIDKGKDKPFHEPSELELAMLKDIIRHPFDGVVKRIKRLQTSRRKGTAALGALEEHDFITPAQVYTGTSLIKLFSITKQGRAFCHDRNFGPLPEPTSGGIEHRYWVHYIANTLKAKGWKTTEEHQVSTDLIVDVHAQKDDCLVAILYETGKSNIKRNLTKTLRAGYTEIWVCSNNPQVLKLASKIPDHTSSPVTIRFMIPNKV